MNKYVGKIELCQIYYWDLYEFKLSDNTEYPSKVVGFINDDRYKLLQKNNLIYDNNLFRFNWI